jgi:membrane protein
MTSFLREKANNFSLVIKEYLIAFQKNNNFEAAAALSYYSFFALIPLLLLSVYLLGNLLTSFHSALQEIEGLLPKVAPEINKFLIKEVQVLSRHKALWGSFTLLSLIWLIAPFAKASRSAFSKIFKFEGEYSYLKAKLFDTLGIFIFLIMFVLLVTSEFLYSLYVDTFLIDLPTMMDISYLLGPFFLALIGLVFFYRFFIPVKLSWLYLLTGSLLTVSLWSLIRPAFSLLLRINPYYGFAFGSLKTFFLFVIWVYYSFAALLVGAEIMANMKRKEALLLKGLFFNLKAGRKIPAKFIRAFEQGDIVFKEGAIGQEMFYILSGAVSINVNEKIIRVMREGEYFGEMAMLLKAPRTATIKVVEPGTRLVCISQDNFETLLKENHIIVLTILKEMCSRLKISEEEACRVVL